jgi:CBS domain containing-hemolysin-like protein
MDVVVALIILSLLLSALYSGSEIALVAANRLRLIVRARQAKVAAKLTLDMIRNPERFLTVALVGTNIANVAFASLSAAYFRQLLPIGDFAFLVLTSLLVLVVGESLPKSVFREMADWIVESLHPVFEISYRMFLPLILVVQVAVRFVLRAFGAESSIAADIFTKEDIRTMLKGPAIPPQVYEVGDVTVQKVMVPRTQVAALDVATTTDNAIRRFVESGHSKMPVYSESSDNIVGVIYARDLFGRPKSISSIVRGVLTVPETKRCSELLSEFKNSGKSVAVAVNEFGGTAGLVTFEDILEEVLGDIRAEHDSADVALRKITESSIQVRGYVPIREVEEALNVIIPSTDFSTVGGYVVGQLGYVPQVGESHRISEHLHVDIIVSSRTRIEEMKLRRLA